MNRSVLIVDDEPSICMALQRTLKRHHLTVYQANGGDEALKLLETTSVDCIISDQRMPGMKGTELLGIAREQFPDTSRIILSGQSDLQDMEDAINVAGVRQFISKPWDDNHLLEVVNGAISNNFELSIVANDPLISKEKTVKPCILADITQHTALELAIKNDELELVIDDYVSMSVKYDSLHSLCIVWPEQPALSQDDIISMAHEAGFSRTLLTWYLLQAVSYSGLAQQDQILIVDIFDVPALESQSLRKILSLILHPEQRLLFKLSLPAFHQGLHHAHLFPLIQDRQDQYGLLVDTGERAMSTDDLLDQSIQCIAMSGAESMLNDELMNYKRRLLIEAAANSSIKTILSDGSLRSQRHYAKKMKFDFMKAPQ